MKKLFRKLLLVAAVLVGQAFSQVTNPAGITLTTTGTSGPATLTGSQLNIPQYAGGSTAFSGLTSGTNTSAAMLVGAGASLGYSSTGTVNANQVNGAAIPASACALSTNASNQFAALTCTGTGNNVLATSPTLTTPNLGTPSALTLTNATGLPWTGLTGTPSTSQVPVQSLTTTGTSGAATLSGGVLNIPQYAGGSTAFSGLTGGTNTSAAMVVGTGASLTASGSGTITATAVPFSGVTGTPSTTQVPVQSLTTTGSSGAATLSAGVLNIPQYSVGTTTNALTMNNSGSGAASGTTFNGGTAQTISYNTIGAASSGANSNITSLTGLTTPLSPGQGGSGVANTATDTLGTANQNWATLGTGIVKNTTTTGALSDAASSDVISLWTGTCSSSTYLNGAGACATPSGSGTVTASAQYDIAYYPTAGTVSTVQGAAIAGFVYGSASGAPAAATAAQAATLIQGLTGCNTANYVFTPQASDCVAAAGGGLPTSTNGQTYYSSGTTGTATSAILVGGTTNGTYVAPGGVEIGAGTVYVDTYSATGYATFNGSCGSAVTTSCTITNGTNLDPNGGVVWAGVGDGGNDGEWIKYSSATSTTITFASGGRGYWGSTANTHGNGIQLPLVTLAVVKNATSAPYEIGLQTGARFGGSPSVNGSNGLGLSATVSVGGTLYASAVALSNAGNNDATMNRNLGQFYITNDSANSTQVFPGNTLDYSIATQTITATTLTAITNALTPAYQQNGTAAASGTGGVLSSRCQIIWNQATGGTVKFGVAASAAPTDLWVTEIDSPGAYTAPTYTTITSTTVTQTSGTVTPSAFGTTYKSDLVLVMNPGTSNSPSVQLYALTSSGADTLTIEPGTGCSAWN